MYDCNNDITLISGRSGEIFKKEVVRFLVDKHGYSKKIDGATISKDFNCSEIFTQLGQTQANKRIHFFQCFYDPNTNRLLDSILGSGINEIDKKEILMRTLTENRDIMGMFIYGDAIKRADTDKVSIYLPMLPYARQDKKDDGRVPITAKLIFDLIDRAFGRQLKNINICDPHAPQEQAFWDGPVKTFSLEPLYALTLMEHFNLSDIAIGAITKPIDEIVVGSPDSGGVKKAKSLAKILNVPLVYVDKRRPKHGVVVVDSIVGKVKGKKVIWIDDIGDSYGTLNTDSKIIVEQGGANSEIYACVTHNLMSISYDDNGNRIIPEDLIRGRIKLITTNTVPRTLDYYSKNKDIYAAVINVASYFADLVHCNTTGASFSEYIEAYKLFAKENKKSELIKDFKLEDILIKY